MSCCTRLRGYGVTPGGPTGGPVADPCAECAQTGNTQACNDCADGGGTPNPPAKIPWLGLSLGLAGLAILFKRKPRRS